MWTVEHFKKNVYGVRFGVVSNHKHYKAFYGLTGNKTFPSRLTLWVDRILPFDFNVVHTPRRTLGMADNLSRHPSPYEGNVVKAEEMFNNWFTINVIDGITSTLNKAKRTNVPKPIRSLNGEKELNTQVLTVHAPVHKLNQSKQVEKLQESETMAEQLDLANSKISKVYVQANYQSDKTFHKIIILVRGRVLALISRLPPPWREKFNSFSVDKKGYYAWIRGSFFRRICAKTYFVLSTSAMLAGMQC